MIARYYRELLGYLARTLHDRDAAADVAQDSFVRVLSMQHAGQAVSDPRALLFHTARNLVIDQHRRATVRRHVDFDALEEHTHPHAPAHLEPENALHAQQHARHLLNAIESLPARCREAFILNRFDGLKHDEVAARMGISRNMVAQHIVRAVRACRDCEDEFLGQHTADSPEAGRRA